MKKIILPSFLTIIFLGILVLALFLQPKNTNIENTPLSEPNITGSIRKLSPEELIGDVNNNQATGAIQSLQSPAIPTTPAVPITPATPTIPATPKAEDTNNSSLIPSQPDISSPSSLSPESQKPVSSFNIINRLMPLTHSSARSKLHDVTHVVIHFASNVIARPDNPHVPEDVMNIFLRYGVSAHYLIARDGTIFRLVDESRNAFHAGRGSLTEFPHYTNNLNRHSIGIELLGMGTEAEMSPRYISRAVYRSIPAIHTGFTDAQYMALNYLLPQIYKRHNIQANRRYVIGHDEYARGRKIDPGILFDWSKIGF